MKRWLYRRLMVPPLLAGYRLYAWRNEKARAFFSLRENMMERLKEAAAGWPPNGRGVLVHVASVGELLQAMPVMKALKEEKKVPLVVLSYTSPSVMRNLPQGIPAEYLTPAPLDLRPHTDLFLDLVSPHLIIFSTYDLWPNLVWSAADRGIPMVLINASLPPRAGRLRPGVRGFYRTVYSLLREVGAVSAADAKRYQELGVPPSRLQITGNCRFDQTLARCRALNPEDPDLAVLPGADFLLIAGSTWPEDHRRLLPALFELMSHYPQLAAVIAPHEPSQTQVAEVEEFFRGRGMEVTRYSRLRSGEVRKAGRVVVVDVLGILYKLYQKGQAAYVGGSFGRGVHSVMEPAGMGLPVIVGPRYQNSAEAREMIEAGGAVSVKDEESLRAVLERYLNSAEERKAAGRAALSVVEGSAGATARTMALLAAYLG